MNKEQEINEQRTIKNCFLANIYEADKLLE